MFAHIVKAMLNAYEANDIDTFFQFVSPRVVWKLYATDLLSGRYDKLAIHSLWQLYADPEKFVYIDRQVKELAVDAEHRTASFIVEEERWTVDGDQEVLHASLFLVFDENLQVVRVVNFMKEE